MPEDWKNGGFGLYLHWPFCQAKCPYCDFNSHVRQTINQQLWLKAYLSEIERYAALVPGRLLNSIYLGGGTPSLMEPALVHGILDKVRDSWTLANDIEITLEANPNSVEADRFKEYANAGVNRVSLGIQALNDTDLKRLGRLHTADEALRALDIAKTHFSRVSFDLIYSRQDQSQQSWESELNQALTLAGDHLSLYQLTIEDGTAFADRFMAGKLRGLPDDDQSADMFEFTRGLCQNAGFHNYEVSNFALPGAESRHNLIYWHYGDYIGIGPGAHGRITLNNQRYATETHLKPEDWLAKVKSGNSDQQITKMSATEQSQEYLMMGLRLTEGVDMVRYEQISGSQLNPAIVKDLEELGMLTLCDSRLCVTTKGRTLLNAVTAELLRD